MADISTCHWCGSSRPEARKRGPFACGVIDFDDSTLYRDDDRTPACELVERLTRERDEAVAELGRLRLVIGDTRDWLCRTGRRGTAHEMNLTEALESNGEGADDE